MAAGKKELPAWKQFEQLVARIESDASKEGLTVVSADRIRCKITGRKGEVDASIRGKIGTADVLITIECRKRHSKQDVTWIEQLAAKRDAIGASCTIAVGPQDFTAGAEMVARRHGIRLRRLSDISIDEINRLIRIEFVWFTHKRGALASVGLRFARTDQWSVPQLDAIDEFLPESTSAEAPIFRTIETGAQWSLDKLWKDLQECTDPFEGLQKGGKPVVRSACFPFPNNVTVETANGQKLLGDVNLRVALWLEVEQVDLSAARKVEYTSPEGIALQRVEFSSQHAQPDDWRLSLQMPKDGTNLRQVRTGGSWPKTKSR
jgi:Restriction endonuclease